jgi:hypothetical protein
LRLAHLTLRMNPDSGTIRETGLRDV